MKFPPSLFKATIFFLAVLLINGTSFGSERETNITGLASQERGEVIQAIKRIAQLNNPDYLPVLVALKEKRLQTSDNSLIVIVDKEKGGQGINPLSGKLVDTSSLKLIKPRINNSIRRDLNPLIAQLQLLSPEKALRLAGAEALSDTPRSSAVPNLKTALIREQDPEIKAELEYVLALNEINGTEKQRRLAAIQVLASSGRSRANAVLLPLMEKNSDGSFVEPDNDIRREVQKALKSAETSRVFAETVGNLLRGVSLGSVLLLASLGLAITFGIMRVINMAHGEMLMIGAYTTYITQIVFQQHLPSLFNWYLLIAVPASFVIAGAVGILMERTVIRFLYGRPLETLLATWGLSLVLIQAVRQIFGAQNVEVTNPSWLSGGLTIAEGFVFPYSRIAIIFFAATIVFVVWYLFQFTNLGLKVRAVTQNRNMASSLGISSSKTDMWTFGLGSAIAGLGGVALSQLGNVGPELGQGYIVDSFMVVVLGGVGKIIGTIISAVGLGIVNKFLEPVTGAVLGKIFVLVFIILFIQKRPQGIFALQGRAAED